MPSFETGTPGLPAKQLENSSCRTAFYWQSRLLEMYIYFFEMVALPRYESVLSIGKWEFWCVVSWKIDLQPLLVVTVLIM